jgi:hypothetical protein
MFPFEKANRCLRHWLEAIFRGNLRALQLADSPMREIETLSVAFPLSLSRSEGSFISIIPWGLQSSEMFLQDFNRFH